MEGTRYKILIILLICLSANTRASFKSEIYAAYVTNNMANWKRIIDKMEGAKNKSQDYILELVNYQYGYIAWCIGNQKSEEAKKYLELYEKNISILAKDKENLSMVNSYKAAFYGYRIGLNRLLVPYIGPRSIECAKLAIKLDKENALGYIQYANIQFYMPSIFGGSKKEALHYYLKAQEIMEKHQAEIAENWNYLSLLTTIAQSYYYLNDYQSSIFYFEKILKLEPDFGYVKAELYPRVLNKMKG